jgi:hypothetical protein
LSSSRGRAFPQHDQAPAIRPDRLRRQRQQGGVDRQDRSLRRQIIGGRTGRRRHDDPVGDQLGHALALVDHDPQARRLGGLPEQINLVDGVMQVDAVVAVGRAHQKRIDLGFMRRLEPRAQIVRRVFVHQEADGAAMHAVDRLSRVHVLVQRLQHQAVAAERDHDIGLLGVAIAIVPGELDIGGLRLAARAGDEGDPVVSRGFGHGLSGRPAGWRKFRRARLYEVALYCRG